MRRNRKSGYVLLTAAGVGLGLLCFTGLAVDVGYLHMLKRRMQAAADGAAIAGVREMKDHTVGNVTTAARTDASLNGYADGADGIVVDVRNPPTSGFYAGETTAVEVVISKPMPLFFLQALGQRTATVAARSVGRLNAGNYCLYALSPSAGPALEVNGGGSVEVGCGSIVNSSDSRALTLTGNSCLTGDAIDIVGDVRDNSTCPPSNNLHTGAQPEADPLQYLSPPPAGACNYTNTRINNPTVLSPGVYCDGITVTAGATVTLMPGLYILNGGGLSVSGGASLSGTGVTFYNTEGGGYTYRPISYSGGANTVLTAPTTGSYAGVLFFQDRNVSSTANNSITGGVDAKFEGILYFPTTPLIFAGGAQGNAAYTVIIADTVKVSGDTKLTNDYSALPSGTVLRSAAVLGE